MVGYDHKKKFRTWHLAALLGLASMAPSPLLKAAPPTDAAREAADVAAARGVLDEFERDFNRNDVDRATSWYDPSLAGILQPEFMTYEGYLKGVREMMADPGRPQLRLEIHTASALADGLVLLNGRATTTYTDGRELREIFTVICRRIHGRWKVIYSHS